MNAADTAVRAALAAGVPVDLAAEVGDFVRLLERHFQGKPECGRRPNDPHHIKSARLLLDSLALPTND